MVMLEPDSQDVIELTSSEADKMIQHLALRTRDEAFRKGIGLGRPWRDTNATDLRFPKFVELIRILSVAISNDEPRSDPLVVHPHRRVARLLHYPLGIRMIGAWTAVDPSTAQMNEGKDISVANATEGKHGFRKEIARDDAVYMGMNERRPRNRGSLCRLLWVGEVPFFLENLPNSRRTNPDSQFLELSNNTTISPTQVFGSQAENQPAGREWSSRPARSLKMLGSAQLPKPFLIGFRHNDVYQFIDVVVHRGTQPKEFGPLRWRRHDATRVDARSKHSDLRLEKPQPCVVSGTHPLRRQRNQRKMYRVHVDSFRPQNVTKRLDYIVRQTVAIFPNPLENHDRLLGHKLLLTI